MKPLLSLSLDADNQWSYMKTHGDPGWESFPSYLDRLAEVALERLERHKLRITFFLVGQDAAIESNGPALRSLADAGHEIGNHSFHHEPWMHTYSEAQVVEEIRSAEEAILRATGQKPHGFRGPGFCLSRTILRVLSERDYLYDASTFPTFLGPLARGYYFLHSRGLSEEEREKRKLLFGSLRDGLRPLDPYVWNLAQGKSLLEIPVTTMPVFRAPFHLSYLIWLSGFSRLLARAYLRSAITLCRLSRTQPSFLLHPLDLLGKDHVRGLEFFPGMQRTTAEKLAIFDEVIGVLQRSFRVVSMEEHARAVREEPRLVRTSLEAMALP